MIIAKSHNEMIINLDPLFILHVAHCPNAQTQRTDPTHESPSLVGSTHFAAAPCGAAVLRSLQSLWVIERQ